MSAVRKRNGVSSHSQKDRCLDEWTAGAQCLTPAELTRRCSRSPALEDNPVEPPGKESIRTDWSEAGSPGLHGGRPPLPPGSRVGKIPWVKVPRGRGECSYAPRSPSAGAHLDNAWCLQWTDWRGGGAEKAAPLPPTLPPALPIHPPLLLPAAAEAQPLEGSC